MVGEMLPFSSSYFVELCFLPRLGRQWARLVAIFGVPPKASASEGKGSGDATCRDESSEAGEEAVLSDSTGFHTRGES